MSNDNDLSDTIIAKSDQLNASDLIEPITITVTRVDKTASKDQPVLVHSEGRQPFKPCLTMRRMLVAAWGKLKDEWVGRSMIIYCDPEVMWAGKANGGIRVSHVSHINEPINRMLNVSSGRKSMFTLLPLITVDYTSLVAEYAELDQDGKNEMWQKLSPDQQAAIIKAFDNQ